MHVFASKLKCALGFGSLNINIYMYEEVCIYIGGYLMNIYIYIYLHIYTYIYIHIYIHIYTFATNRFLNHILESHTYIYIHVDYKTHPCVYRHTRPVSTQLWPHMGGRFGFAGLFCTSDSRPWVRKANWMGLVTTTWVEG